VSACQRQRGSRRPSEQPLPLYNRNHVGVALRALGIGDRLCPVRAWGKAMRSRCCLRRFSSPCHGLAVDHARKPSRLLMTSVPQAGRRRQVVAGGSQVGRRRVAGRSQAGRRRVAGGSRPLSPPNSTADSHETSTRLPTQLDSRSAPARLLCGLVVVVNAAARIPVLGPTRCTALAATK